jgi:DNA-binding ferritin-like protein
MAHDPNGAAAYAIWHDPTQYNHFAHGPPYLPGQTVDGAPIASARPKTAAVGADTPLMLPPSQWLAGASPEKVFGLLKAQYAGPFGLMGVLLSMLRAETVIHQTHHWQTRGPDYYGDHLLFDRLYNDTNGLIDSWAERTVSTGGVEYVGPVIQMAHQAVLVAYAQPEGLEGPANFPACSLAVVKMAIALVEAVRADLTALNMLSSGTDNMLQGIADKHEEFVYLLNQRTAKTASQSGYKYDCR